MQSDDSAQSAGESQNKYQEEDHFLDQTEDTYIKSEFDPGQYNTDGLRRNEWRSRKQISSDEMEEEAVP